MGGPESSSATSQPVQRHGILLKVCRHWSRQTATCMTKQGQATNENAYLSVLAPGFSDGISQVPIAVRLNVGHDTSIAKHCIAGSSDHSCKGLLGDLRPSKAEELVDWHAQSTELGSIRQQFLELRIVALSLQRH